MGKQLILAEKPSVAREIARVLGARQNQNGYIEGPRHIVTWALGHLVTLAEPEAYGNKYRTWSLETLPMLPEKMELVVIAKTAKQFSVIRGLMGRQDVSDLVIATDSGREGELVARWIMEKAGFRKPAYRLWISSQTDKAIRDGFAALKPAAQYDNLYKSAVCRAQADWFVGLNVTRALACKHNAQLSAGRVQTPTLSMIVDREEEIRYFKPQEYFRIAALASPAGTGAGSASRAVTGAGSSALTRTGAGSSANSFTLVWQDKKTKNARIFDKAAADALVAKLAGKPGKVISVVRKRHVDPPPQAYDLTELQRDANRRYSYSAKTTLSILQGLYEIHKLVTYPRTDSRYISRDVADTLPDRLRAINKGSYAAIAGALLRGGLSLTDRFVNDSKVTDHHAIIPTEQPMNMAALDNDEKRIYDLIVKRFLAVLSKAGDYEETSVTAEIADERFAARGRVPGDPGWRVIYAGGVGLQGGDGPAGGDGGYGGYGGNGGGSHGGNGGAGGAGGYGGYGGNGVAGDDEDADADADDLDVSGIGFATGAAFGAASGAMSGGAYGAASGAVSGGAYGAGPAVYGAAPAQARGRAPGQAPKAQRAAASLPPLKNGDLLKIHSIAQVPGKTKPPARYTEATLLTAMEHPGKFMESRELRDAIENASGIGTPATRADIIEKLFDAFYVERGGKSGKEIIPTSKGKQLIGLVPGDLRSAELTARWEQRLEQIAGRRGGASGALASTRGKNGIAAAGGIAASSGRLSAGGIAASSGRLSAGGATGGDAAFIREIKAYTAKLVSDVVSSTGTFAHDNLTRDHCPDCGKFLLLVNGKKGEMLVCQDRECGYRKSISVVSNARCPNCHKKLTLRGDGDSRVFQCACGYRERLVDFEARRESSVGRREVDRYLAGQSSAGDVGGGLNSALSDQLKALMAPGARDK